MKHVEYRVPLTSSSDDVDDDYYDDDDSPAVSSRSTSFDPSYDEPVSVPRHSSFSHSSFSKTRFFAARSPPAKLESRKSTRLRAAGGRGPVTRHRVAFSPEISEFDSAGRISEEEEEEEEEEGEVSSDSGLGQTTSSFKKKRLAVIAAVRGFFRDMGKSLVHFCEAKLYLLLLILIISFLLLFFFWSRTL
jgi:hypothetical protein